MAQHESAPLPVQLMVHLHPLNAAGRRIKLLFPGKIIMVTHKQVLPALQLGNDFHRLSGAYHGHVPQNVHFVIRIAKTFSSMSTPTKIEIFDF